MRVLIVDDEELARQRLRTLLRDIEGVELAGECADLDEAVAAIASTAPDLVLLDIEMPGDSGLALRERLAAAEAPVVVFVTAHPQHAVAAFRAEPVDYVLKPFDRDRLAEAVARAAREIEQRHQAQLGRRLVELARTGAPPPQRLMLRGVGRVAFLDHDEIDWIDAQGAKSRVHSGGASHLLNESISSLAERLPPARFVKIHRSTVVNLSRVRELEIGRYGDYVLVLQSGHRLSVGRSHRKRLRRLLADMGLADSLAAAATS